MKKSNCPIFYTELKTKLGNLAVAYSAKGICSIQIETASSNPVILLKEELYDRELIKETNKNTGTIKKLTKFFDEYPRCKSDFPLNMIGSDFQIKVWQALRNIPAGSILSYSDLAEAISQPRAMRAVASACASNKIAIIIPCHRIVRKNGELGGFKWGLSKKEELLRFEGLEYASQEY